MVVTGDCDGERDVFSTYRNCDFEDRSKNKNGDREVGRVVGGS